MIGEFIKAATRMVEKYLNRRLVTQTWDFFSDSFPTARFVDSLMASGGITDGRLADFLSTKKFIDIPYFPLQSVTSLNTYDDSNTAYLMPATDYFVDTFSEPGRLCLKNDTVWPSTYLRPINGVGIRFVCGYGAATAVPYELKQAIKEIVGKFYASRGCDDSETSIPATAMALMTSYRVFRLG